MLAKLPLLSSNSTPLKSISLPVTLLVLGFMLLSNFLIGYNLTYQRIFPTDWDSTRFQGQSQAFIEGELWEDPAYLDTKLWYPPLVSWIVGVLHFALNQPVGIIWARMGPYISVINMLGFFILGYRLFGHIIALAIVGLSIYISSLWFPTWASPTFAWIPYPSTTGFIFYIVGVLAHFHAIQKQKLELYILTGAWFGITFLAHNAPALFLIVGFANLEIYNLYSKKIAWPTFLKRIISAGIASIIFASPYLYIIIVEHGLHIQNHSPRYWESYGSPSLLGWGLFFIGSLNPATIFFAKGLHNLIKKPDKQYTFQVAFISAYFSVSVMMALIALFSQILLGESVLIFPAYYWVYFFQVWLLVFAGYGLVNWLNQRAVQRQKPQHFYIQHLYAIFIVLTLVALVNPFYQLGERAGLGHEFSEDAQAFTEWLSANTKRQDVFLAHEDFAQSYIIPINRPVVVTRNLWSNLYLDYSERAADQEEIFRGFNQEPCNPQTDLLAQYQVRYVIFRTPIESCLAHLKLVFNVSDIYVYALES